MAVRKENVYKADMREGEGNGVHLVEQEAERPEKAMSRKERKIYKQRKKQEAQLAKIRAREEAERLKREEKERRREEKRREKLSKKKPSSASGYAGKAGPGRDISFGGEAGERGNAGSTGRTAMGKASGSARGKRGKKDKHMSAQETIRYREMGRDGICRVQDRTYSKTIQFNDINYQLAQNEDKNAIFENWCDFLNYFDSSIHFQLSFINHKSSMEEFENVIRIRRQFDEFDDVRMEYAQMLKNQLAKGNNGLVKSK